MFNRLNQHLQANNILVPEMFGFREGISIQQAVFTLTDNILTTLNQWQHVGGIFSDLSKVFDCVNHEILLCKLNCYGIHGLNIKWFESCLTNREQRLYVIPQNHQHKFSSNWGAMKCGVPQGSVLGLVLFIINISGLLLNMNIDSKLVLFMDDTSVLITANNLRDLQRKPTSVLNQINKWFTANGLSLNKGKTIAMHFKSNNLKDSPFPISYQDKEIKEVTNTKFHGLSLDK